jgi:hypothetical protein
MIFRNLFVSLFLLSLAVSALANVAQPGIWQAGGMKNFALLFPEDSLAFQKIQMVNERVSILIYPGFAVVKGEYWMRNDSDSTLTIQTGYPINGFSESKSNTLMQVWFEELYGLKVYSEGNPIPLRKEVIEDNWYIWDNTFKANSTTKIEVYFLVNTNNASVLQGYNKDYINGFIYLLESGASWKQPILKGEVRIQLKGQLSLKNIKGISPNTDFQKLPAEQILRWQFLDLSPTYRNNVVINYGIRLEDFDFSEVLQAQEKYFASVNTFSLMNLEGYKFEPTNFTSPFEVPNFDGIRPRGLFAWIKLVVNGIGILLVLGLVYFLYRKFRQSGS